MRLPPVRWLPPASYGVVHHRSQRHGGFVPTMKIATNSELAQHQTQLDRLQCRTFSYVDMSQLLDDFINNVVEIVNGKPTKNEINQFRELAIFRVV